MENDATLGVSRKLASSVSTLSMYKSPCERNLTYAMLKKSNILTYPLQRATKDNWWGCCSMLQTVCSTIQKIKPPEIGHVFKFDIGFILVAGKSYGSNPPLNLTLVLILISVADISHGLNPPSNLILVLILVAGMSHGSNLPSTMKLDLILILKLNLILNLILVLMLVADV